MISKTKGLYTGIPILLYRRGKPKEWLKSSEKTKMKQNVTTEKILGTGKNLYLVNWSKCTNFGYKLMRGDSEKEVFNNHLFSRNDEVNFIITKISEENLPVIFKQV